MTGMSSGCDDVSGAEESYVVRTLRRASAAVAGVSSLVGVALLAICVSTAAAGCPNASLMGASSSTPDCRAYEQVSPVNKGGFAAYPVSALPAQVTPSGEGIAYLDYSAFPGALGNSAVLSAHVANRAPEGWRTTELTPAAPEAHVLQVYLVGYSFSEDLSQAVLQVPLAPLTPEATPGVFNLFRRQPDPVDPSKFSYSLVNNAPPKVSGAEICEPASIPAPLCFLVADISSFAGASRDFNHILFESSSQLTPEAPETLIESLYENYGGEVKLVGILPDGKAASTSTEGSGSSISYLSGEQEQDGQIERAISEDGSHVVFQAPADEGAPDPAQSGNTEVYDRINGRETIEISAPAPGATPKVTTPESATFAGASSDGSRVFFTSTAELTTESNTGSENNGQDFYEYVLPTEAVPAGELKDLSVDTNAADASTGAMVQGVVGVSSDGSYVYYVADGQLVPGKGVDGQPNLYMVHDGGSPVFVATLSSAGECHFPTKESADACDWSPHSVVSEAYLTPDGRRLGFMSTMELPTANFPGGYHNIDQKTGEVDSEVYEYSVPTSAEGESDGSGQLVCVSCDPSGASPVSNALIGGITQAIAAPTLGTHPYESPSSPFFKVRALNDSGTRVFYTAAAAHANSYRRVFEYETDGEGSCASVGGCQYMLSGVGSVEPDEFLGASASGNDVFLATSARLSPTDLDNLPDVYDARVDGGFAAPAKESGCEESCRQPGVPPGTPMITSGFPGATGNLAPPPQTKAAPVKKKCSKGRRRIHGRCVTVKKHRAKRADKSRRTR